jgi:hypothetical protein
MPRFPKIPVDVIPVRIVDNLTKKKILDNTPSSILGNNPAGRLA